MRKITSALVLAIMLIPAQSFAGNSGEGKDTFEARCGDLCHQLPEPAMLSFNQWKLVMKVMQKRLAQNEMPELTPLEEENILAYIKGEIEK